MMSYKDYIAHVDFDPEAEIFHGEVINTKDVITFQGTSVKELKKAFTDSVEDYLEFCAARKESPEKPFSGKFNVRIDPALHRQASFLAKLKRISLNQWIIEAISEHIQHQTA